MIGDFIQYLKSSEPIADIVASRVYVAVAPTEAKFPYLVVDATKSPTDYALSGEIGMYTADVQVDCWGEDTNDSDGYFDAERLASAVINRISGYRGLLNDNTFAANISMAGDPIATMERPEDGSDYYRRRVTQSWEVMYQTAVPDFT